MLEQISDQKFDLFNQFMFLLTEFSSGFHVIYCYNMLFALGSTVSVLH